MKKTFTIKNLENELLQDRENKTKLKYNKPNDTSVKRILSYSRSLSCIDTHSIGKVLILNN